MNYKSIANAVFSFFASCTLIGQAPKSEKQGLVHLTTHFYDTIGKVTYTDILKIWYRDSSVIEEINRIGTITNGSGVTRTEYTLILYRYIELKSKTLYDYKSFSDTAKIIHKAILPDSMMLDYGWTFYSDKIIKIKGEPEALTDTTIDNLNYKRAKFSFERHDPKKNFLIGYLRCDRKEILFSLEKRYSRESNCTMVKFFDFKVGRERPYASQEVDFISDMLTSEETKVFDAWERNAKQNPMD